MYGIDSITVVVSGFDKLIFDVATTGFVEEKGTEEVGN